MSIDIFGDEYSDGYSRRTVIAGGIALLSGCLNGPSTSDTQPRPNGTGMNTSATQSTPNETETEQNISDPDGPLSYGETLLDGALEVTVETLSIETSVTIEPRNDANHAEPPREQAFVTGELINAATESQSEADSKEVELPDGQALALAPVTFTNRHETDTIALFAPNFDLVGSELQQEETQSVRLPQIDDPIAPNDLTRFDDLFFRWTTHGSEIEPGESVDAVAMFEVPEGTTTEDVAIVYDSSQWREYSGGHYGTTTARWTV